MLLVPLAVAAALAAPAAGPEADVARADADLSAASARRDAAAFADGVAEDALFGGAAGWAEGREAVRARWAPFFAAGGPSLTWTPERAVVAASGDLAYSVGSWTLKRPGGEPPASGHYATVWRRDGGRWRALLDLGNEPASKLGAALTRTPLRTVRSAAGDLEAVAGTFTRGAGEGGVYLTVRRRAEGGDWQVVLDSAIAGRR